MFLESTSTGIILLSLAMGGSGTLNMTTVKLEKLACKKSYIARHIPRKRYNISFSVMNQVLCRFTSTKFCSATKDLEEIHLLVLEYLIGLVARVKLIATLSLGSCLSCIILSRLLTILQLLNLFTDQRWLRYWRKQAMMRYSRFEQLIALVYALALALTKLVLGRRGLGWHSRRDKDCESCKLLSHHRSDSDISVDDQASYANSASC